MKKFLLVAILLIATITMTGCYDGIVSNEEYAKLISGIEATKQNGETVIYDLDILSDQTHFNDTIESAEYCKLEIRTLKSCSVRGLCFYIRSSKDCNLIFTLFKNNRVLATQTKDVKTDESTSIELFMNYSHTITGSDELYIEIYEELKDNEASTKFMFDTLIIFFEES